MRHSDPQGILCFHTLRDSQYEVQRIQGKSEEEKVELWFVVKGNRGVLLIKLQKICLLLE